MNIRNHRAAEKYLVEHAEATYKANKSFAKHVQSEADYGNRGRDYLANFMQHWLAAWPKKHDRRVYAQLPSGWSVGR